MKKTSLLVLFNFLIFQAFSQIPTEYYTTADGLTGFSLKSELHEIIDGHVSFSYGDVWDFVNTNDLRSDNTIWDIYSDVPGGTPPYTFTPVTDQCGNYSGEGSCYNREHSFPKSWFSDISPMNTDFHHLYPTDGYVNGKRGNYPFGDVASASWTSQNGSKVGSSDVPGYTGTVFEPIDEYKGDLARTYFYMATRYEDIISGWSSDMLDGTANKVYTTWALDMLISWHENDPVSQKEIDRNDAIYSNQGNRNPFVDHPEYVSCVWENTCGGSSAVLTTSVSSLTNFGNVDNGQASTSSNYSLSGTDLSADVVITAPANFEVSLDNSMFSSTLTLTADTDFTIPTLSATTIFVRFAPNLGINGLIEGDITNVSGVASQQVYVSGTEVVVLTSLTISTSALPDFGVIATGEYSESKSYTISGIELTSDLKITAPSDFLISKNDIDFVSIINIPFTEINNNSTTIYVQFAPISNVAGAKSGNIKHESDGISELVSVLGIEQEDVVVEVSISITNLSHTYDGSVKEVLVSTSPENVTVDITYNGSPSLPIDVGEYAVVVNTNDTNYTGSATATMIIEQATATITLTNLSHTYDGTSKSVSINTIPADLEYSVLYNSSEVLPTEAGEYIVEIDITNNNYEGSASSILIIQQATAAITFTNVEHIFDTTEKEVGITTTPADLIVDVTYDASSILPINVGEYDVHASINENNYKGSAVTIITIEQDEAQIVVSDLLHDYDGGPKPVTVTTVPEGVSTNTIYGNSTNPPIEPGSYTVQTSVTDPNYFGSSLDVLTILEVTATSESLSQKGVQIYPNPVKSILQIHVEQKSIIDIYSIQGVNLGHFEFNGNKEISLSHIAQEVVFISITSLKGTISTKLFIEK